MNAMWHDPAASKLMFRLNLAALYFYAGLSVFLSSTYELYQPHVVGHLFSAASVVVVGLYGAHCVLLFWTDRSLRRPWEFNALCLPFVLAAISAWICYRRYYQQI
ncbi:hypothetical protein [Lysobacter sp. CA199]|uniref:hypothetical protein n=1 Tax=Lysobacter sp. CA199 TaxID=3455608 RepID=UPI003F8D3244